MFVAHHHPVSLSASEVNGTAIATGAFPARSSVIADADYRPAIDPRAPVGIEVPKVVRRGDAVSDGHYLNTVTVAEILPAQGRSTVIAGTKQVALLFDRHERSAATAGSPVLFEGMTMPPAVAAEVTAELDAFPAIGADEDQCARDAWTTRALTMDGRVLSEALTIEAPPLHPYRLQQLTARQALPAGEWRQYLAVSEVNGVRYLDEGNGAWTPTDQR